MAGLDTRGLASGFAQGFGLMNQYQQQQRQNELAERQMGMQEQKFGLDMQMGQMRIDEVEREREKEALTFALARGAEFGPEGLSEDDIALLRSKPQVWAAFDNRADAAIRRAMDVFDPGTSIDANDIESLDQANLLFQDMINKGEGGQKRIVGWYPAPDGEAMMAELEITREDGSTYRAPMTEGRGTEEDAIVKRIPLEDLANHIQGLRQVRNGINMGGDEFRANASRMLRVLRGDPAPERWEQVQGPGGSLLQRNTVTGEMELVIGRAPQPRADYSNRATALERDIEYLVSTGLADDRDTAWNMLNKDGPGEYERGRHQLKNYQDRLSELEKIKSGREWQGLNEEQRGQVNSQIQDLRDRRDDLAETLWRDRRQPSPQGDRYPREGDMVGNPGSSGATVEDILNSVPWE
ncbi:MAG TPA: hypothetical protein DDZ35_11990 [Halomonas sp.]|nr:hypothetical protein [Halomonas sp.]